jgi:tetratricopeptide (TPR) repeat protein
VVRRYALVRWTAVVVVVAALLALAAIQAASEALYAGAAVPGTLANHIPSQFGLAVYRMLDRIAPAPYVESTLSQVALQRNDANAAQRYALRLPASPLRDELLARVAQLRGEQSLALEYFLAAPDADAVELAAQALAARNPARAYELERELAARLAQLAAHPDALAEVSWRSGQLANRTAWVQVPGGTVQRMWLRRGLDDFEAAVALSPLSERYVIAAANQADLLGRRDRAAQLFAQAIQIDPSSADAIAGLGVIAFERRDRIAATQYLQRARAIDPQSLMVRALERDLR